MASLHAPLQSGLPLPEKTKAVQNILDKLEVDLKTQSLNDADRDSLLEELKLFGRDPCASKPIFDTKSIEILAKHGFQTPSKPYNRQALRCLANAMFLNQDARGKLVDLGYMPWACVQISQGGVEDEFLGSRILFFSTYATKSHILDLIDSHKLADSIVKNLARHTEALPSTPADPIVDLALTDTLNLLFNVTSFLYKEHPNKLPAFGGTIPHVVSLLLNRQIPSPRPLDRPMDKLISALINMKLEQCSDILYPCSSPTALPCRFVELMDRAFLAYSDCELETVLTPLAALLLRILPSTPPEVRSYMKSQLLPQDSDRSQVLGRGDSLPSKILRNTTNAMAPELGSLLNHLLFELSDSDAAQFVDNVGYGFASGYLFQHNIPVPCSIQEAHGDIHPVNPITGQYVENENVLDMPEMTKEEKEREAERLFVLFERLRQTGVVNIENPAAQAYQPGRIQDPESDAEEEDLD